MFCELFLPKGTLTRVFIYFRLTLQIWIFLVNFLNVPPPKIQVKKSTLDIPFLHCLLVSKK